VGPIGPWSHAKQLSNPISDLVSVPFQFKREQEVGAEDQTRFILNVQPVIPFTLTKDWNLITPVIVPFVNQPALEPAALPRPAWVGAPTGRPTTTSGRCRSISFVP
jgi:hypothetical protein